MLGEEHPDTLSSMRGLAIGYREVSRREEALQLTEKVVATMKRTFGEEHPDTLGSMHSLAISYSEVGRREEGAAADGEGGGGNEEDARRGTSENTSITRRSNHF